MWKEQENYEKVKKFLLVIIFLLGNDDEDGKVL
jgi:hypothetical protein